MTREIKFRAWDKITKRWLGNDWAVTADGAFYNISEITGTITSDKEDIKIMQYTGLKDKNGVEIYEGDVISGPAEWFTSGSKNNVDIIEDIANLPTRQGDWSIHMDDYELIGNIYENPELLTVD